MSNHLSVTFSPHLQDRTSIKSITYTTMAALLPAVAAGFYYFGFRAIIITLLSMVTAVCAESLMQKLMKRPLTINDGTAALTGLLLAMLLPVGSPWWAVIIGSAVAIILGRQLFGGLGANPFNAVLVGWVVLQLSWPAAVDVFYEITPICEGWGELAPLDNSELPLALLQFGDSGGVLEMYSMGDILKGAIPGGLGSTSVIALLLGGLYLVWKGYVPWQIPAGFLGGLFVFALICWMADGAGETYANPFHHLLLGYTLIGAFFLAPDQATSPYTSTGALIYGIGAGVLTMIIRYWGANTDGVIYAILFLNALTPVLDRITFRSYGRVKTA